MCEPNFMVMNDQLTTFLYEYGLISDFEISPFSVYKIFITFHVLLVKILSVSVGCSGTKTEIITFSDTHCYAWKWHPCIADSFVILNIGSFELKPMSR